MANPTTQPVRWIRPSGTAGDQPIWGIGGGMSIGLWPASGGPRGLIRIFTPYLDQPPGRIMNFIAVEPIVGGVRCLSEIERSAADNVPGKRIVSFDQFDPKHVPTSAATPARGVVQQISAIQTLHIYLGVERLENGAHPVIEITFRSDRPHEIALRTFAAADSAAMQACVLTATMGNYARLRHLQLKDGVADAAAVFANEKKDVLNFLPWHEWPADRLLQRGDEVTVSATGDPDAAPPPPANWRGWPYDGMQAVQTWSTANHPGAVLRVNGRTTFYGTHADIPGGAAFENFELLAAYHDGDAFRFAIERVAGK